MKMKFKKASLTGYSVAEEAALQSPRGLLSHRSETLREKLCFCSLSAYVEYLYRIFDLLCIHISPGQGSKQK